MLQLLPENSIQLEQDAENQVPQNLTEMQKIHKLVRIYCPFTYIHFKNVRKIFFFASQMKRLREHKSSFAVPKLIKQLRSTATVVRKCHFGEAALYGYRVQATLQRRAQVAHGPWP